MSQDARYDEEQSTLRRARVLGFDYFDTYKTTKQLFKSILSIDEMYRDKIVPLMSSDSNILFGITTITSQNTLKNIKARFLDQRVSFAIISDTGYRDYMKLYDPPKQVVYQDITIKNDTQKDSINEISKILSQVNSTDMLAYLVSQAHRLNASDIHVETETDNEVQIRFRIDGVLHLIAKMTFDKYRILVSAIASAANISTASINPQQGHIAQKVLMADQTKVDVNVRVETVVTVNGMDIVMRLFNMYQDMYNLDKLGLSSDERRVVDGIIAKPSGLVLVVGPTGSGKTTTLYSMLNSLNNEQRKIITIEDPVEYQFHGISQISVISDPSGKNDNFSSQLRAVLRLDPDIIMIGEIRDEDTARTALQAALTGHLVLATFHAASASAALTRLSSIIGKNPLFISAIRLIMAQRLVRKLDDNTKESYHPTLEEIEILNRLIKTLPSNIEKPVISHDTILYRAKPTDDNPYGYKGQIAIREQYLMTDKIKQVVTNNSQLSVISTEQIETAASESNIISMLADATLKILAGETTIEEVSRVLDY